jgi:hypothetical protein
MSWPCFLIRSIRQSDARRVALPPGQVRNEHHLLYTLPDGREVSFDDLPIGACWRSHEQPNYYGAPGWCVVLPGKGIWRTGEAASGGGHWTITGDAPHLTAAEAIHYIGIYHGRLVDGVVSDDADGRQYDELGYLAAREGKGSK